MTRQPRQRSRVPFRTIVADAYLTVRSRPGRSLGVGIAAALGIATLVGIIQLSISANAQVQRSIDQARPEVLRASPVPANPDIVAQISPTDLQTARGLDGVRAYIEESDGSTMKGLHLFQVRDENEPDSI